MSDLPITSFPYTYAYGLYCALCSHIVHRSTDVCRHKSDPDTLITPSAPSLQTPHTTLDNVFNRLRSTYCCCACFLLQLFGASVSGDTQPWSLVMWHMAPYPRRLMVSGGMKNWMNKEPERAHAVFNSQPTVCIVLTHQLYLTCISMCIKWLTEKCKQHRSISSHSCWSGASERVHTNRTITGSELRWVKVHIIKQDNTLSRMTTSVFRWHLLWIETVSEV